MFNPKTLAVIISAIVFSFSGKLCAESPKRTEEWQKRKQTFLNAPILDVTREKQDKLNRALESKKKKLQEENAKLLSPPAQLNPLPQSETSAPTPSITKPNPEESTPVSSSLNKNSNEADRPYCSYNSYLQTFCFHPLSKHEWKLCSDIYAECVQAPPHPSPSNISLLPINILKSSNSFPVKIQIEASKYLGSIDAIQGVKEIAKNSSLILSFEKIEGMVPVSSHSIDFLTLSPSPTIHFSLPTQAGLYGLYLCNDSQKENVCGHKKFHSLSEILFEAAQKGNQRKVDYLYGFQLLLWDGSSRLSVMDAKHLSESSFAELDKLFGPYKAKTFFSKISSSIPALRLLSIVPKERSNILLLDRATKKD